MYTTLLRSGDLEFIGADRHHELLKALPGMILRKGRPELYCLARNPYDRLVSFFFDKVRKHPQGHASPGFRWQECQQLLWPYMDLPVGAADAVIAQRMLRTRFDEFVDMVGDYFGRTGLDELEPHLAPQFRSLRWIVRLGRFRVGVPLVSRLYRPVRIEDAESLRRIHDPADRQNATSHGAHREYFDRSTYSIVNALYRQDFRRFGYEMETG